MTDQPKLDPFFTDTHAVVNRCAKCAADLFHRPKVQITVEKSLWAIHLSEGTRINAKVLCLLCFRDWEKLHPDAVAIGTPAADERLREHYDQLSFLESRETGLAKVV